MDLTNQQTQARSAIFNWYNEGIRPYFYLTGWAGTGKTTLVRHLVDEAKGHVAVLAPTNKAVRVLRDKGIGHAETIHRFLRLGPSTGFCNCGSETVFHAKDCPKLKMKFGRIMTAEDEMPPDPTLIIVDEASMVNKRLAQEVLNIGIPVLAVGDPFQLPPVDGEPYWDKPDFELTHIQRQAADNPIIQLAHKVRTGATLRPGSWGDAAKIVRGSVLDLDVDLDDWNQILTYRHVTRTMLNTRVRSAYGRDTSPWPIVGEQVMLKSSHKQLGLANGDIYAAAGHQEFGDAIDLKLEVEPFKYTRLSAWKLGFGDSEDWKRLESMDHDVKRQHGRVMYAYAITVHSAQGSEWDNVLIEQDGNRNRRWIYTALTRARERMIFCMGG